MMIPEVMNGIGYEINSLPDNKVTVAQVAMCTNIADDIEKYCSKSTQPIMSTLQQSEGDMDTMYPGIKAVAKCAEEDEFDEETGNKLAVAKAELKYLKKKQKIFKKYLRMLQLAVEEIEKMMEINEKEIKKSEYKNEKIYKNL